MTLNKLLACTLLMLALSLSVQAGDDPVPEYTFSLDTGELWPNGIYPIVFRTDANQEVLGEIELQVDPSTHVVSGFLTVRGSTSELSGTWNVKTRRLDVRATYGFSTIRVRGRLGTDGFISARARVATLGGSSLAIPLVGLKRFSLDLSDAPSVSFSGRVSVARKGKQSLRGVGYASMALDGAHFAMTPVALAGRKTVKLSFDAGFRVKVKSAKMASNGALVGRLKQVHPRGSTQRTFELSRSLVLPDVRLLFVSGHDFVRGTFLRRRNSSYLQGTCGPVLTEALVDAGYVVETAYFVDEASTTDAGGYKQLRAKLQYLGALEQETPGDRTKVFVIAHSHGGVWAHAAIATSSVSIDGLVDLDTNDFLWGISHTVADNIALGASPSKFYGDFQSEAVTLTDVVPHNVFFNLELRSVDDQYDRALNVRVDETVRGITSPPRFSQDHSELHSSTSIGGPVLLVRSWLLEHASAIDGRYSLVFTRSGADESSTVFTTSTVANTRYVGPSEETIELGAVRSGAVAAYATGTLRERSRTQPRGHDVLVEVEFSPPDDVVEPFARVLIDFDGGVGLDVGRDGLQALEGYRHRAIQIPPGRSTISMKADAVYYYWIGAAEAAEGTTIPLVVTPP